jgi:hypothetical protein
MTNDAAKHANDAAILVGIVAAGQETAAEISRSIRGLAFFYRIGPQVLLAEGLAQFHQLVREFLETTSRGDLFAIDCGLFGPDAPGHPQSAAPLLLFRASRA